MELLKAVLEYTGLILAAIFGITGTAFEAHDEIKENINGKEIVKKKINNWGKLAIGGIAISLFFSAASKFVEFRIDKENEEINRTFQDSVSRRTAQISSNLTTSLSLSNQQLDSLRRMDSLVKDNNSKQEKNLREQDKIVNQTKLLMQPLFPLRFDFSFYINLDSADDLTNQRIWSFVNYFQYYRREFNNRPGFGFGTSYDYPGVHPVGDTVIHVTLRRSTPFEGLDYPKDSFDSAIVNFERFIYNNFIPSDIMVSMSAKGSINDKNGLVFDLNLISFLTENQNNYLFYDVGFDLMCNKRPGGEYKYLNISFSVYPKNLQNSGQYSMLQFDHGIIYVDVQPLTDDLTKRRFHGAKAHLQGLYLNCGQDYNLSYPFILNEQNNLISDYGDKRYKIKIKL